MFIPKIKQKVGGEISGILIDPKTGLEYRGAFVQDHVGNFYKGESITNKSNPLEYIENPEILEKVKQLNYAYTFRKPSELDYKRGAYTRYFYKDLRTGIVKELNEEKYNYHSSNPKLYIKVLKINWNLREKKLNKSKFEDTKLENEVVMEQAEKELPGIISQILKSPQQFVL